MRKAVFALALVLALPCTREARAGDQVLAESLFRQGRAAMDSADYATAYERLAESFAQDPSTGTLLALAVCQERLGRTASAWASYAEVVSRSRREGRADREQAAKERADALEPKLSRLTVEVDPATAGLPGLVVKRSGHAIGRGAWGTPTPVDPGEQVVEASAPGKEAWSKTVTIGAEADVQSVTVPALADVPAAASEAAAPAAAPTPGPAEPGRDRPFFNGGTTQTIGFALGGAGLIGLGASLYFGLHASSLNSASKAGGHCDSSSACDSYGYAKRKDAAADADVATVLLLAGTGLTAAGATLVIVGANGPTDARIEAAPRVAPGVAGLSLGGRY